MSDTKTKWEESQIDKNYHWVSTAGYHVYQEPCMDAFGKIKKEGKKYSQDKAPMGMLLKQFPLALEAVAMRSKQGHEGKYRDQDRDWMNFKRVPNAIEQYTDGTARHLADIGDDEDNLGHASATAWNALARLQLIMENKK